MWVGDEKNGALEDFDYCATCFNLTDFKDEKAMLKWCLKNCKKNYKMAKHSCWFQIREDAEAFESKWL